MLGIILDIEVAMCSQGRPLVFKIVHVWSGCRPQAVISISTLPLERGQSAKGKGTCPLPASNSQADFPPTHLCPHPHGNWCKEECNLFILHLEYTDIRSKTSMAYLKFSHCLTCTQGCIRFQLWLKTSHFYKSS
jgi:hypothetical protein